MDKQLISDLAAYDPGLHPGAIVAIVLAVGIGAVFVAAMLPGRGVQPSKVAIPILAVVAAAAGLIGHNLSSERLSPQEHTQAAVATYLRDAHDLTVTGPAKLNIDDIKVGRAEVPTVTTGGTAVTAVVSWWSASDTVIFRTIDPNAPAADEATHAEPTAEPTPWLDKATAEPTPWLDKATVFKSTDKDAAAISEEIAGKDATDTPGKSTSMHTYRSNGTTTTYLSTDKRTSPDRP